MSIFKSLQERKSIYRFIRWRNNFESKQYCMTSISAVEMELANKRRSEADCCPKEGADGTNSIIILRAICINSWVFRFTWFNFSKVLLKDKRSYIQMCLFKFRSSKSNVGFWNSYACYYVHINTKNFQMWLYSYIKTCNLIWCFS